MATAISPTTDRAIAADATVGAVALTVADLHRSRAFYETVIGLSAHERDTGELALGPVGGEPLVVLHGDRNAPPLQRRAPGLFHLALLVPSRLELARVLARLARTRWPLDGASDHLVSEALYLSDPDGNGIEIYRDRPRDEWTYDERGQLEMATLRLDLQSVARELGGSAAVPDAVATDTRMGHVHLQVSDLAGAQAFYHGMLGFDVVVRTYPGALFVSAGGYHHHLGLNTWNSAGSPPAVAGAVGLRSFEVLVPSRDELERLLGRVRSTGLSADAAGSGHVVRDPFGNAVVLRCRS